MHPSTPRRVKIQVGLRIVELREDRGLTQEELAERVDLSTKQIQRFEAGRSALNVAQIFKIAAALGVEPVALLQPPTRVITRAPGRKPSKA